MIRQPHRNTIRAKNVRAELVSKLGGACALCATPDSEETPLEFDHIYGRDYTVSRLSYLQRLNRYKREAEIGLLRLLCGPCNRAVRKTDENGRHIPTNASVMKTQELVVVEEEL